MTILNINFRHSNRSAICSSYSPIKLESQIQCCVNSILSQRQNNRAFWTHSCSSTFSRRKKKVGGVCMHFNWVDKENIYRCNIYRESRWDQDRGVAQKAKLSCCLLQIGRLQHYTNQSSCRYIQALFTSEWSHLKTKHSNTIGTN